MKVYTLHWDYDHLSEVDYDIDIIKFDGFDQLDLKRKLMKPEILELKQDLYFLANLKSVNRLDFPVSKGYLVLSQKMIDTLVSVRNFRYFLYPTVLLDDTFLGDVFLPNGVLNPKIKVLRCFSILQTLEILNNCFDYEQSEYKPLVAGQIYPTIIKKMVLKVPSTSFPPVFRIIEKRSVVFVSQEAKNKLEENKITGCRFKPVDVSQ